MKVVNHAIDLIHNIYKNKVSTRTRNNKFLMPPEGVTNAMLCDDPLKEALIGVFIAGGSYLDDDTHVPDENNHPYLPIVSEFRCEGN